MDKVTEKLNEDIKKLLGRIASSIELQVDPNIENMYDKVNDIVRQYYMFPDRISYNKETGLLNIGLGILDGGKVGPLEKALDVQQENYLKLSAQYGVLEKERNQYRDMVDRMHNAIHAVGYSLANSLPYEYATEILENTDFRNEFWEIQRVNRNEGRPFYTYLDGELVLVKLA